MIETQLSKNGALVVKENENALCSTYEPLQEASNWVQRIDTKKIQQALVLGLGAGHHIEELVKQAPHIQLSVLDHRSQLVELFETHHPFVFDRVKFFCFHKENGIDDRLYDFVEDLQPTILCFRPSWKGHEIFYADLFASLTFRNLQRIERSLKREIQNNIIDISRLSSEKNLLHLKNLYDSLQDFGSEEALKISVLRELWI